MEIGESKGRDPSEFSSITITGNHHELLVMRNFTRNPSILVYRKDICADPTLSVPELSLEDGQQLWEGLFYAMWFQDKPLLQESLSKEMGNLIHKLPSFRSQLVFLRAHFIVMSSHWDGLDKIRIDKFLMLVRDVLHEALVLLHNSSWDMKHILRFRSALKASILDVDHMSTPLVFHFADIYPSELKKVAGRKLKPKLVTQMIMPFVHLMPTVSLSLLKQFSKAIFDEEFWHMPSVVVQRNFGQLAKILFKYGSAEGVGKKNRQEIYNIVQRYRKLEKGLPARPLPDMDEGKDLDMEDVEEAALRLLSEKRQMDEEEEKIPRKRRKKMVVENPNIIDLDNEVWLDQKDKFLDY
ncbi:RRP1B [Cordylochernes scorpioides]|uniref:RRP1B n=1 Tax=Cordylochernes scorpioides TaxID=51811 RepID=A0ABY6K1B3_9ARAC|nr:RRP1B [Cordylochernes scorpioides]